MTSRAACLSDPAFAFPHLNSCSYVFNSPARSEPRKLPTPTLNPSKGRAAFQAARSASLFSVWLWVCRGPSRTSVISLAIPKFPDGYCRGASYSRSKNHKGWSLQDTGLGLGNVYGGAQVRAPGIPSQQQHHQKAETHMTQPHTCSSKTLTCLKLLAPGWGDTGGSRGTQHAGEPVWRVPDSVWSEPVEASAPCAGLASLRALSSPCKLTDRNPVNFVSGSPAPPIHRLTQTPECEALGAPASHPTSHSQRCCEYWGAGEGAIMLPETATSSFPVLRSLNPWGCQSYK